MNLDELAKAIHALLAMRRNTVRAIDVTSALETREGLWRADDDEDWKTLCKSWARTVARTDDSVRVVVVDPPVTLGDLLHEAPRTLAEATERVMASLTPKEREIVERRIAKRTEAEMGVEREEIKGVEIEDVVSLALEREGTKLVLVVQTQTAEHRFRMAPDFAYESARRMGIEAAHLIHDRNGTAANSGANTDTTKLGGS